MPSAIASSTPVTVTVCAAFQFAVVNVNDVGDTVPSPVSLDDTPIVTSAVGWRLGRAVSGGCARASVGGRLGGVRSRAIRLDCYRMADGAEDYAFVHATLKLGAGRDEATKKRAGDALFEVVKTHFAALYEKRYLALSMEMAEFSEAGTWKHNNVHARFKKAQA